MAFARALAARESTKAVAFTDQDATTLSTSALTTNDDSDMFSARAISLSFTGVLPTTPEEAVREQVYTSVDAVPAEVWLH